QGRLRRKKSVKRTRRSTLVQSSDATQKQSDPRDGAQTQQEMRHGSARRNLINDLYVEIWDRMFRAISHTVVNHQTDNWPQYFTGLRDLTRRVVAEGATSSLSATEKTYLAHRLVQRIDELEKWW